MRKTRNRYRIVVAGDPWMAYRLCVCFAENRVIRAREMPPEYKASGLPKDEWIKTLLVDTQNQTVRVELVVELHGPWIWDLYNVVSPSDYFGRFAGVIMVVNLRTQGLVRDMARLVLSIDSFTQTRRPAVLVYDASQGYGSNDLSLAEEAFRPRAIGTSPVDFETCYGAEQSFKLLAVRLIQTRDEDVSESSSHRQSTGPYRACSE